MARINLEGRTTGSSAILAPQKNAIDVVGGAAERPTTESSPRRAEEPTLLSKAIPRPTPRADAGVQEQLQNARGRRVRADQGAVAQPEHRVDLLGRHGRERLVDLWSTARFGSNQLEPQRPCATSFRTSGYPRQAGLSGLKSNAHTLDARNHLLQQLQTLLAPLTTGQG